MCILWLIFIGRIIKKKGKIKSNNKNIEKEKKNRIPLPHSRTAMPTFTPLSNTLPSSLASINFHDLHYSNKDQPTKVGVNKQLWMTQQNLWWWSMGKAVGLVAVWERMSGGYWGGVGGRFGGAKRWDRVVEVGTWEGHGYG